MVLGIYTNVPSLQTRRWLQLSTEATQKATRRLSSGLRINEAADDISGMSIAVELNAQVRSAASAGRSVADGLSLLGQADAALGQQNEILQQIRERAVQAASDNVNSQIRDMLDVDATQLATELEHIARSTSFNGMQLLDGSFSARSLRVGTSSKTDDDLEVNIVSSSAAEIGGVKSSPDVFEEDLYQGGAGARIVPGGWDPGEVTVKVGAQTTTVPPPAGNTARDYAAAFNSVKAATGVTAQALTVWPCNFSQTTLATGPGDVAINGIAVPAFQNSSASDTGPGSAVDAINSVTTQTGVRAALGAGNRMTLTADDGRDITVAVSNTGALATGVWNTTTVGNVRGGLKFTSDQSFTLGDTSGANMSGGHWGQTALGTAGATSTATQAVIGATSHVSDIDLTTRAGALLAIQIADQAMTEISSQRSAIGATCNRLSSARAVLDVGSEMASAAASRIMDADYAAEASALSKGQILQQSGLAVLSQANMHPQLVLSLLKGN